MTLDYKNTLYAIILAFFSIDLVHDWEWLNDCVYTTFAFTVM